MHETDELTIVLGDEGCLIGPVHGAKRCLPPRSASGGIKVVKQRLRQEPGVGSLPGPRVDFCNPRGIAQLRWTDTHLAIISRDATTHYPA